MPEKPIAESPETEMIDLSAISPAGAAPALRAKSQNFTAKLSSREWLVMPL